MTRLYWKSKMLVTVIHPNFKGTGTAVERHRGVTIEASQYFRNVRFLKSAQIFSSSVLPSGLSPPSYEKRRFGQKFTVVSPMMHAL